MTILTPTTAFSRVIALAAQRPVHAAFTWLHANPKTMMDWQQELVAIPAPSRAEQARSEWLAARFGEIGLKQIAIDEVGNVCGILPAAKLPPESTGPVIVLSAHLDTVFPAGTPLTPKLDGDRIETPGVCDNVAGVVGMMAIARALVESEVELPAPLVVLGNVCEEGEGDLLGVRHFYQHGALAGRIAAHIVLDGAGTEEAVTQALGSRRFRATIAGPGGHSFSDAGTPNPIAALATALAALVETPLPTEPRTTLNLGTIQGGISVNSIPAQAVATVDFRSTAAEQLDRLEAELSGNLTETVERCNAKCKAAGAEARGLLSFTMEKIGDRPAARLAEDSTLFATLQAVDRHLQLRTEARLGSTDANIPLSLGIPALSMGAGGEGGGAHTRAEWYSARNREAGLRRALLLTLAMLEWAAEQ